MESSGETGTSEHGGASPMKSVACVVPACSGDMNTSSPGQIHSPAGALYVSTALMHWATREPERIARDVQINDTAYRRLDPEYYAWLRAKMSLAQLAAKAGKLDGAVFDALRDRFNAVHEWAMTQFGERQLLDAMRSLDTRAYAPPVAEPDLPHQKAKAIPRAEEAVSAEATALVDAIRERAVSLGWKRERLYATGRRRIGSTCGLVCFMRPGVLIGEVTRQSIEIIGSPPGEIRQRFYSPDVEQPWIARLHESPRSASAPAAMSLFSNHHPPNCGRDRWPTGSIGY